jgi:hypothetical protein
MEIEMDGTVADMNTIIQRIQDATKNCEYDDVFVVAGIRDLWEACRNYLMRFEIVSLNREDADTHIERDTGEPVDWDEHVRHRLAVAGQKYGYAEVTAVVKDVEYRSAEAGEIRSSLDKNQEPDGRAVTTRGDGEPWRCPHCGAGTAVLMRSGYCTMTTPLAELGSDGNWDECAEKTEWEFEDEPQIEFRCDSCDTELDLGGDEEDEGDNEHEDH